ncbi:S1 domain-containing RNA-binding protein [Haloimpatiens sp. FM7315]|uniref:S1 domain-containing RNA-binding protein n=1 Tax=Haloimpatiens sp. FM7315 TaxID=3298609 RepID=UPI0035A2D4D7
MTLKIGSITEGRVVNITNFGAFVEVEGKTGLVHISEVSESYVKDVSKHLKENEKVKVKVLSIDDNGRMSLSIKQANPPKKTFRPAEIDWQKEKGKNEPINFEDRMSKFLKESEEKFQDIKKHQNLKNGGRNKKSTSV